MGVQLTTGDPLMMSVRRNQYIPYLPSERRCTNRRSNDVTPTRPLWLQYSTVLFAREFLETTGTLS